MDVMLLETDAPRRPGLVSLDGRSYPLDSAALDARAEGGMAVTTLRQTFRNPHEEPLEVLYTLPLPADGAVLGYGVRIGDRRIVGEVRSREEAEAAYREALYEGRTTGLLEQDRDDTFQQRLGNVPAGQPVEIEIHVLHPLGFRAGGDLAEWEYRFPTTVGVRYMGGPGRVHDAERLEPGRSMGAIPARVSLDLRVGDPVPAAAIRSPSHAITSVTDELPGRETFGASIRFVEPQRLDRDVVIRWRALEVATAVRVVEGSGLEGDDGRYALVTVLPPRTPDATHRRDVTLLLDASGSMDGAPLALAKRIAADLLAGLEPGDRFELIAFATSPQPLSGGLVSATPQTVAAALERLAAQRASGGTEMLSALDDALRPLREDTQRQVVLLTDGYIGFEGEVVARAARGLPAGVRVHVVGVGSSPNRTLTRNLTRAGRGKELFAGDEATAEEAARMLGKATARPVLTDLRIGGDGVRQVAPARAADVLAGQPAIFTVELAPGGGTVQVTGREASSTEPWGWTVDVPPARPSADPSPGSRRAGELPWTPLPLGALHGREVVAELELERAGSADRARIDSEIEARALRHRIASRRTSLVAIAEEVSVDPRAPRRRLRLAVELPAGVSAEGVGLLTGGIARDPRVSASRSDSYYVPAAHEDIAAAAEADFTLADPSLDGESDGMPFVISERTHPTPHPGPRRIDISEADVVHHTPELLVVEFEVPWSGFLLPDRAVRVVLDDGRVVDAEVDRGRSTHPGPHSGGLRVRLALRSAGGAAWPDVRSVALRWNPRSGPQR